MNAINDYYIAHANERVAEAFLQDALHTRQHFIEHPEIGKPISKRSRAQAFKHFPYFLIHRYHQH